ncbi:MAG: hypothetical protein GY803_09970, partial [Chloroflexi bacterium]|nr:hypothetical protein [Chloroflexota bacterium]
ADNAAAPSAAAAGPTPPPADIYTSRNPSSGLVNTSHQAVLGPNICSLFGDPYSPLAPDWADWYLDSSANYQGLSTYQYRILIPPDYPHDVVRVELFDPDSINRANNIGDPQTGSYQAEVAHTANTIGLPTDHPPRTITPTELLSCNEDWINPCLIDTDEIYTGLPLDEINLYWFVRIDENRRPPCGSGGYDPLNNTQTQYFLHYYAQQQGGPIINIPLAEYIGQVGDGARDAGDHETDMRWVSPGGTPAFDRSEAVKAAWPDVDVPALAGIGIESFEVNISNNLSNILIDSETGNRYLYLDVTAFSGSSENGFEIWAGPPDYVDTVPSNVNLRNVHILNNPGSHDSDGIVVYSLGTKP